MYRKENKEDETALCHQCRRPDVGIQTHTLRYYEKIGVVRPSRSQSNRRLYSDRDIARLKQVKRLMEELGINLAGIDVILRLTEQVNQLQQRLQDLESQLREQE